MFRLAGPLGFARMIACDPYAKAEDAAALGVELVDLETLFRESDIVTVNTLLSPQTRGMVNERLFRMMKPTAFFINTARGPIVDHDALVRALRERWICGAGIDVFPVEPTPKDDPLFALDNVIVTPHSMAWTHDSMHDMGAEACESVLAVARGDDPGGVVNKDVLARPGLPPEARTLSESLMKPNRFKQVVAEGRIPVGHMIMEFGTRGIAKILEAAGVDFVVIDMEHTGFDSERIADLMAWFKATPVAPFVRVPQGFYHFLARTMDAGALGVMVANVETGEQARSIVDAVKYAPLGARGVALSVAHTDYTAPPAADYFAESNANTTVICLIESAKGIANLDAIAGTPGVDVLWVGHYDLTQSMGIPGQFQHPRFLEAIRAVIDDRAAARQASRHSAAQ